LLGCWDLSVSCPDGLRRFDLGEPLKLKNTSLKPKKGNVKRPMFHALFSENRMLFSQKYVR
jgi:hypothetical protein